MSIMMNHLGPEPFSEQSMSDVLKKLNPIELRKYNNLRKPSPNRINKKYKELFKDFYYCTDMTPEYEEKFFTIFRENCENGITFDYVLRTTTEDKTGECYPFLCSNLVNLIDEEQPVFSANTLIALGLDNFPTKNSDQYIDIYHQMKQGLRGEIAEEWFEIWKYEFNEYFEDYEELLDFGDMKMVDLFCWRNKLIRNFGNIETSDFNIPYERTYLLSRIASVLRMRGTLPKPNLYHPHILHRTRIDVWLYLLQKGLIQYCQHTIDDTDIDDFINDLEHRNYATPNYIDSLRVLESRQVIEKLHVSNMLRLIKFKNRDAFGENDNRIIKDIIDIRNHWAHPNLKNRMGTFGHSRIRTLRELSHRLLDLLTRDMQDADHIGREFFDEYRKNKILKT